MKPVLYDESIFSPVSQSVSHLVEVVNEKPFCETEHFVKKKKKSFAFSWSVYNYSLRKKKKIGGKNILIKYRNGCFGSRRSNGYHWKYAIFATGLSVTIIDHGRFLLRKKNLTQNLFHL